MSRHSVSHPLRGLAFLSLALALHACTDQPPPDLHVVAAWPQDRERAPFSIRFDRPAVAAEAVGPVLRDPPVALDPPVPVTAHWADPHTLVIQPGALPPSTRYKVRLLGTLAERTGNATFTFVNEPLEIVGVFQAPVLLPDAVTVTVRFDQPVRARDVARRCSLLGAGLTTRLTAVDPAATATEVTLRAPPLQSATAYTFRCANVWPARGQVPLLKPVVRTLTTVPDFAVTEVEPSGPEPVPSDDVEFSLSFSTPVDEALLPAALTLQPPAPGLADGWFGGDGTTYRVSLDLRAHTTYTLTLAPGVRDVFGRELPADATRSWTFRTGAARPELHVDQGIHAVESEPGRVAVWTRNLARFQVRCATVAAADVAAVLEAGFDDAKAKPGVAPALAAWSWLPEARTVRMAVAAPADAWVATHLDLGQTCGGESRGVVLAEFTADPWVQTATDDREPPRFWTLANVTDLGVLVRLGPGSGIAWVTRFSTGQPVAQVAVTAYRVDGSVAFRGTTDASGLLRLPGLASLLPAPRPGAPGAVAPPVELEDEDLDDAEAVRLDGRLVFVAATKGDVAVVDRDWNDGVEPWQFDVDWQGAYGRSTLRGLLMTDRGIYRPGETAHLKGFFREHAGSSPATSAGSGRLQDGLPRVPASRTVQVRVDDPRGSLLLERELTLSDFGTFAFDVVLPEQARLGDCEVTAVLSGSADGAGGTLKQAFLVEAFRKATFEVQLQPAAAKVLAGGLVSLHATARYLFGAPVAKAKVAWRVERRPQVLAFPGLAEFQFGDAANDSDDDDDPGRTFVADGEAVTDGEGAVAFAVHATAESDGGPQTYLASAEISDTTGETRYASTAVVVHQASRYVGLAAPAMAAAGTPVEVRLAAVDLAGASTTAVAVLTVSREAWTCTDEAYGSRSSRSCKNRHDVVESRMVTVSANTLTRILFPAPGGYRLRAEAEGGRGFPVAASRHVWVTGSGGTDWGTDDGVRIELVPSQAQYRPGDRLRMLARTSLTHGSALVTLERSGVLEAKVVPLTGAGQVFELPIDASHIPNVFASVALVSGRRGGQGDAHRPRLQMGLVHLPVAADQRKLQVTVTTDAAAYQPGERVRGRIRVTANGRPLRAEVALSVADEGVLQLAGYETPDPADVFYAPWGLAVTTATNWTRILRPSDPETDDPDEGGDSGRPGVRTRFLSSAFWAPALQTGADGEATFAFDAPDSLTAYRVMAVVADAGTRFGSNDMRIAVRKPLMAQPALPRFLTVGDKAVLGVQVFNRSGHGGEVTVRAAGTGLQFAQSERRVVLADGDKQQVGFEVTALEPAFGQDSATVEFDIQSGRLRDTVRVVLPLVRPLAIDRQMLGQGAVPGRLDLPVTWPQGFVPDASRLEIAVDRTGLASLRDGLDSLIQYPYGCLEQTLSRFVPLAKVKDLAASLGLPAEFQGGRIDRFVAAGAAKLLTFQDTDGHFGLWPGSAGEPHFTAMALQGVVEARRAGIAVDPLLVDKAVAALGDWAEAESPTSPGGSATTLALAAFVLADLGQPDGSLNARLFEARRGLQRTGKAWLLRALALAKAPLSQRNTLLAELAADVVVDRDGNLHVTETYTPGSWWHDTGSRVRPLAEILSALVEAQPEHPLVPRLAEALLQAQGRDGPWVDTQDNASAIKALADYARLHRTGQVQVEVRLGERRLFAENLQGLAVGAVSLPLADLAPGTLTIQADGPLRHRVRLVVASRIGHAGPVDRGFQLERTWRDALTGKPIDKLRPGQLVVVTVTLRSPVARRYVALVDALPAGLEAVSQRYDAPPGQHLPHVDGDGWAWNYVELRDQQVQAFADDLGKGTTVFTYMARATVPGTFFAAPATAEAMYEPEIQGRSATATLVVQ